MLQALCTLTLLAFVGCGSTEPAPAAGDLRVLFIGNSLTYSHDIPALVSGLGESSDGPQVRSASVTVGGYSLEDHWVLGEALDSIARGGWDFVVLQQGPSTVPANRQHLVEWATRFAERIRAAGAEPAIYMIWPSNGDFDAVSRSYTDAARAVNGMLIPAGEAFRALARDHPDIGIFDTDQFHPSPLGSYLAALVIYGRLTGQTVANMAHTRPFPGINTAQAAELEQAADRANRDFGGD